MMTISSHDSSEEVDGDTGKNATKEYLKARQKKRINMTGDSGSAA